MRDCKVVPLSFYGFPVPIIAFALLGIEAHHALAHCLLPGRGGLATLHEDWPINQLPVGEYHVTSGTSIGGPLNYRVEHAHRANPPSYPSAIVAGVRNPLDAHLLPLL